MPPLHRYLGNPVLTWIGRLFFKCPIGDFHCGLRGFDRAAIDRLGLRTTGMEFASELVVKATLQGLKVTEVPTTLSPGGRSRRPHLRTWRDGWRHLRFLLLFSPRWLFLYPGGGLMLVGLLSMFWLLPGPRAVGGVTFDVHTLVFSAAAVVCGFQAVAFSILAKVFAINAGLLPDDARMTKLVDVVSLEVGIVVGLVFVIGGVIASASALGAWGGCGVTFDVHTLVFSAAAVVCGFQAVAFSILAKVFAINAGLLPDDARMTKLVDVVSLEVGIVVGLVFVIGGVIASASALGAWGGASFGPVDPTVTMRIVVPAATAMVLGLQIVFASFFLGVLGLKWR